MKKLSDRHVKAIQSLAPLLASERVTSNPILNDLPDEAGLAGEPSPEWLGTSGDGQDFKKLNPKTKIE